MSRLTTKQRRARRRRRGHYGDARRRFLAHVDRIFARKYMLIGASIESVLFGSERTLVTWDS